MLFDLPLTELRVYKPEREEPADFDAFWADTLADARKHPLAPRFEPVDAGLMAIDVWDVTFAGFGGQPIKGWFLAPRDVAASPFARGGKLPCLVEYIGYGGGRGLPIDWLLAPSAGHATLVMDTRGQGSSWRSGDTPDLGGQETTGQLPGLHDPRHPRSGDLLLPPPHDRRGAGRRGRARSSADRSGPPGRHGRQPGRRADARRRGPRPGPADRDAGRAVPVPLAPRHRDHRRLPLPGDRRFRPHPPRFRSSASSGRCPTSTASTSRFGQRPRPSSRSG